jgi:hypothetical protein
MGSQESVSNVEMARKELAKAVATNESRELQRNFLQQFCVKLTKCASLHI